LVRLVHILLVESNVLIVLVLVGVISHSVEIVLLEFHGVRVLGWKYLPLLHILRQPRKIIHKRLITIRSCYPITFVICHSLRIKIWSFIRNKWKMLLLILSIKIPCAIRYLNLWELTKIIALSEILLPGKLTAKPVFKVIPIRLKRLRLSIVLRCLRFLSSLLINLKGNMSMFAVTFWQLLVIPQWGFSFKLKTWSLSLWLWSMWLLIPIIRLLSEASVPITLRFTALRLLDVIAWEEILRKVPGLNLC